MSSIGTMITVFKKEGRNSESQSYIYIWMSSLIWQKKRIFIVYTVVWANLWYTKRYEDSEIQKKREEVRF